MSEIEFLNWVRGDGLNLAIGVFLVGVIWRLI